MRTSVGLRLYGGGFTSGIVESWGAKRPEKLRKILGVYWILVILLISSITVRPISVKFSCNQWKFFAARPKFSHNDQKQWNRGIVSIFIHLMIFINLMMRKYGSRNYMRHESACGTKATATCCGGWGYAFLYVSLHRQKSSKSFKKWAFPEKKFLAQHLP